MAPQSVATLIRCADGMVLSVSRKHHPLDKGLPGGKVEDEETLEEASIRETQEETGLRILKQRLVFRAECEGFDAYVFEATEWEGHLHTDEPAAVEWVHPSELLLPVCTYADFNQALFRELGINVSGH
jgi:8-oxo-dGTP diphosphatase